MSPVSELESAIAWSPKREERKLASTARIGTKSTPNRRKNDTRDLKILELCFIKQTKYHEISFSILLI